MSWWKKVVTAFIMGFTIFSANADEIYYCYSDVVGNFNSESPGQLNMYLADYFDTPTLDGAYSIALNLTKMQIDYNDLHGGSVDGNDWVDAIDVNTEKNKWIMTSPIIKYIEADPGIIKVYFDQKTLHYTEIDIHIHNYDLNYGDPDADASSRSLIITSGRCKMNLS